MHEFLFQLLLPLQNLDVVMCRFPAIVPHMQDISVVHQLLSCVLELLFVQYQLAANLHCREEKRAMPSGFVVLVHEIVPERLRPRRNPFVRALAPIEFQNLVKIRKIRFMDAEPVRPVRISDADSRFRIRQGLRGGHQILFPMQDESQASASLTSTSVFFPTKIAGNPSVFDSFRILSRPIPIRFP